jgi:hypothetical protein
VVVEEWQEVEVINGTTLTVLNMLLVFYWLQVGACFVSNIYILYAI